MDEPTVAVDPQSRNSILEGIKKLNKNGATIIYTTHYMEEVEQICSRIMIMDKGREIASGTKEELKGLIRTGEKISVEVSELAPDILEKIRKAEGVLNAEYEGNLLQVQCESGGHSLITLLDILKKNKIYFGRIFSEPPTLNDVFLEITGKELRD